MRISDWSSDVCSSDLHVKDVIQRLALGQRAAQRVGRVDAGDFQRTRVQVCAGEWFHVRGYRGLQLQVAAFVHDQRHRGDFEQGVVFGVEAAEIGRAACRERVCQYV